MTRAMVMALAIILLGGAKPAPPYEARQPAPPYEARQPAPPYGAQQQAPTFRARADVVAVDVSVRDGARVLTNLKAEDFDVLDNDVPQQVTDVSFGKAPIDVTVVLDVSQSVTGTTLERLRRAITQLMRDLNPQDRLKLVTFNMRVSRIVDFTSDIAEVGAALRAAFSGGGSSVWDAVAVSLVSASAPDRRQLVVLFSDAVDTSSTIDADTLVDVAQRTTASFSAVIASAVPMAFVGSGARSGSAVVQRLATESGGGVFPLSGANADLTAVFRRVLDQFRSSYVLHFTPTGVERAGFHALKVTVRGRERLTITARRGYFW